LNYSVSTTALDTACFMAWCAQFSTLVVADAKIKQLTSVMLCNHIDCIASHEFHHFLRLFNGAKFIQSESIITTVPRHHKRVYGDVEANLQALSVSTK
jgi:hypothetical protein